MRTLICGVIMGVAFGYAVAASAQQFTTGRDYIRWSGSSQSGYAVGFWHGLIQSTMKRAKAIEVRECMRTWVGVQAEGAIYRYIRDHPERGSEWVGDLAWEALAMSCNVTP